MIRTQTQNTFGNLMMVSDTHGV